jgi:gas vesicle protein
MALKTIPIEATKEFAKKYEYDQLIIIGYDAFNDITSVATYGNTIVDSSQAAEAGNHIKGKIYNWPKNLCKAVPDRIKKLKDRIKELEVEIRTLKSKS